jgi:hypothetical protein
MHRSLCCISRRIFDNKLASEIGRVCLQFNALLLGLVKYLVGVCVDQNIFALRGDGLVEVGLAVELGMGRHVDFRQIS